MPTVHPNAALGGRRTSFENNDHYNPSVDFQARR
jgi:hypothetical protein